MKLIPRNWSEFQQYKDRRPQWIKLHRDLLNNYAYSSVQIGTKATLPLLWLLACEYEDGIIDASLDEISFRIHIDKSTVGTAIDELIEHKFFTLVQDCTEAYKSVPREEKRREEIEGQKEDVEFSFTLNKLTTFKNLSSEYRNKLKEYISSCVGMSYEDFESSCIMKNYKYVNFKMAYDKWGKDKTKTEAVQNKPKRFV